MASTLGGSPGGNAQQAELHASIKARLSAMFGSDATVTWSATLLQGITPAR